MKPQVETRALTVGQRTFSIGRILHHLSSAWMFVYHYCSTRACVVARRPFLLKHGEYRLGGQGRHVIQRKLSPPPMDTITKGVVVGRSSRRDHVGLLNMFQHIMYSRLVREGSCLNKMDRAQTGLIILPCGNSLDAANDERTQLASPHAGSRIYTLLHTV